MLPILVTERYTCSMEMSVALKDTFVANLRELLRERKMSQSDLAERLHVTPAYVSHLIHGRRTPQLETLEKLAKALSCHPSELLSEKIR